MFLYSTPSDKTKQKLLSLGYPDFRILSYPEIAEWLGDEKKCIISPEMINSGDPFLEKNILGIVYLEHEQTIKCGTYVSVSEAVKDMVEYVLDEQYEWLSKSKIERTI